MNSKKLFLGVALLLALGLTACGGNKTSQGGKSELESSVEEESSSKRSRSSRSSTEPEPAKLTLMQKRDSIIETITRKVNS